ncbi:MAG: hypothetical protein IPJ41_00090 [Phycisphaerales bacterium]|nr:hypothetical protein [Phycisphaerales bacterium]
MKKNYMGAGAILLLAAAGASAQWSDNFDSYSNGQQLFGVGGWTGWDDSQAAAGTATDAMSLSGPNSITVSGTSDAIHPFSGYTSGVWNFTAQQYIPSNLDALTYFILNNQYNHGGPYDWGVEMHMDPTTGMVNENIHDVNGDMATPILYDQWVEISTMIDLDNNYMESYYGGAMVASGAWNAYTGGIIELQNVDLYAPHSVAVYYDDLSLTAVPTPGGLALLPIGALAMRRRRR